MSRIRIFSALGIVLTGCVPVVRHTPPPPSRVVVVSNDEDRSRLRVPPGHYLRRFGPLLLRELQADLFGRGSPPEAADYRAAACPRWATPVPARLMDSVRLTTTLAQVGRQIRQRRLDFLLDHHIDSAQLLIDRIERLAR